MNKTQAGRLLTLAHFLKTEVPRHKFNLLWYCNPADQRTTLAELQDTTCKTAACALGWCPIVFPGKWVNPEFPRLVVDYAPELSTRLSAKIFFGLSDEEIDHLFLPSNKKRELITRTPMQEAHAIETLVGDYGWTYA